MSDDNLIISGFDSRSNDALMTIDFALAKPLDRGGSTCDAYECVVQRRRVFVKRLKAEYRDNPLYRAAFDKEYDLGVSLSHPSLPRYIGFGGDYIVMDFVEGDTLADLLKRDDRRLKDKSFVRKLLGEMVDVVEYLHRRNIVHCDIKADNVILSPYDDRPVTLIDLDKAYTSWLSDTYGDAAKYGCDGCADGMIDFRGIGKIAQSLGQKRFAALCGTDNVSSSCLKQNLRSKGHMILWISLIAAIAIGVSVGIVAMEWPSAEDSVSSVPEAVPVQNTVHVKQDSDLVQPPVAKEQPKLKPSVDAGWLSSMMARKMDGLKTMRSELMAKMDNDTVPYNQVYNEVMEYMVGSGSVQSDIIYTAVTHYPNLSELDVQTVVRSHPAWISLTGEDEALLSRLQTYRAVHSNR